MRWSSTFAVLAFHLCLAARAGSPAPPGDAPPFPLERVRPGLTGTGYSVFSGKEPATFQAEVLGVVNRGSGLQRLIVCRLSGAKVERTGILQGMSGSPIFVEGRLLGALSTGWAFSKEPLCGVTPAEEMLAVRDRAQSGRAAAERTSGPPVGWDGFVERALPTCGSSRAGAPAPAPPNFHKETLARLTDSGFQWTLASGEGPTLSPSGPPPAAPSAGQMVGVQLVSGDVQFTAFGTVTWSDGRSFLAFGHPFLELGSLEMPVVAAEVVAPVPSAAIGFKLCDAGVPIGVALEDRPAGVFGRFGGSARMVRVRAAISGPGLPPREYSFEVVDNPQVTPALAGSALALLGSHLDDPVQAKTLRMAAIRFKVEGRADIELRDQVFSGSTGFVSAAEFLSAALDLIMNNSFEPLRPRSVEVRIEVAPGRSGFHLRDAWADRSSAGPGEDLEIRARLQAYQGGDRDLSATLPARALPAGRLTVTVGSASEVARLAAAADPRPPKTADEVLARLAEFPSSRSLAVAVFQDQPGRILELRRVGDSPPSIEALFGGRPLAGSSKADARRLVWLGTVDAGAAVDGTVEFDVEVRHAGDASR